MMKKIHLSFITLIISLSSFAQHEPNADEIQNSGKFLWGVGVGNSYQQADRNALDNLITQISVQVESSFENFLTETDGNLEEYTKSVIKTYSNVTLVSAKSMLIDEKRGMYEVMRYMAKDDLNAIFENRKLRIFDYVKSGLIAEKKSRIGDALKNYYWAMVLLRSHKDNDNLECDFQEQGKRLLITALPDRITALFTGLRFTIKEIEDVPADQYKAIHLYITYQDKPVENLDYVFWTGRNYSNLISCRSGIGIIELFGDVEYQVNELKLIVEYAYSQKTGMDNEVRSVFDNVNLPYFARSEFEIELPENELPKPPQAVQQLKEIDFEKLNQVEHIRKIRKNVLKIIEAIDQNNYTGLDEYFTPNGMQVFNQLIKSSSVKILPNDKVPNMISMGDKTVIRSVPMKLSYHNNQRSFIEQVVFTFDKEQKVETISFAISDKAIDDIVSRSYRFGTVEDKYQLINFMEYYKTAYCLKRLAYIEKIFADNALIIVGNVVREAEPIDGMYSKVGFERVKFIELSKGEYLERLRMVFGSNEFVNIHFEENIVKKVNGDDKIYGIQIKQDYYSTTYADKGYLFLMIDLNDSINPKIYVRTWQPEKNVDGSIFGLNDFEIN
ncbi:MAG: LPP20 family lipoprotein [Bacteroidales bacterium]|nr:LPP20 family lipoprotein [Bacteroidales bacterium]